MTDRDASESQAKEEDRGLVCRKCGCRHFYVVYTRPTRKGKVLRRRECRHCGRRFSTVESELS